MFITCTDAEAKAPIFELPDVKSQAIGKDPDAEKDWRQEGKGMTKDEMVGWHHWLNGHEFRQTVGDSRVTKSWTWLLATEHQQMCRLRVIPLLLGFPVKNRVFPSRLRLHRHACHMGRSMPSRLCAGHDHDSPSKRDGTCLHEEFSLPFGCWGKWAFEFHHR